MHQTLPLYSHLKTVGVYVHAGDFDIRRRAATITAESEVRNEHTEARVFTFEVTVMETDGRVVRRFSSEPTTLQAS